MYFPVLDLETAVAFALFVVGIAFAFGILPAIVLPKPMGARNGLDAYAINLIRWLAFIILVSHVLAGLGIYHLLSWTAAIALLAWFARYRHYHDRPADLLKWFFSSSDRREPRRTPSSRKTPTRTSKSWRQHLALAAPALLVFAGSWWLRAVPSFGSVRLHPPDAYVHMAWAQSLIDNQLWPDGLYPQGLPGIVAFLDLTNPFVTIAEVARFTGPLVGTSLVVAIYYTVVRLTRQPGAALFAAGLIGLFGALPQWRVPWHRQAGLLPQELALSIALIAVVLAVLAVTDAGSDRQFKLGGGRSITISRYAVWTGMAAFVASMMHPIATLFLGLMIGIAALAATLISRRYGQLLLTGLASLLGAGIGQLVLPVGQAFGFQMYPGWETAGGLDAVFVQVDRTTRQDQLLTIWNDLSILGHNELSIAAGVGVLIAIAGVIAMRARGSRERAAQLFGLTAVAGMLVALHDLTNIMYVITDLYLTRFMGIVGQLLPLAFGAAFGSLALLRRSFRLRQIAVLVGVGLVGLAGFAVAAPAIADGENIHLAPEASETEYEQTAVQTLRLRDEFPRGQYTVIGTSTQRQLLTGHGWFVEAWVFARDAPDIPIDEPLPVPTRHALLFVELDPFPVKELPPFGASEEYYLDREKRGRIQAILYEWAERRLRANDDTSIYFDGDHLRIYQISRDLMQVPVEDPNVLSDYTWEPGELFNEGPTSPRQVEVDSFSDLSGVMG